MRNPSGARRFRWADLFGIAWIVLLALLYLSPALKDGPTFGPADLGQGLSFLTRSGTSVPPAHNTVDGDIIDQAVAWNTLDWRLVHHGELPLWNDLSGNGLPQLLNFQSAPLALPTLVGYLFPLSLAFLVTVLMKLLIAGTGAYVLTRLLGGRPLAGAMAGTTFMLSGSFAGWLGWAVSGPLAWAGWLAAAAVLVYRARPGRRAPAVALLSLCVAFCIYGGFPETYVLLAGGLTVFLLVVGLATLASRRRIDLGGIGRLGAGTAGGLALSSPLWLPGLAVVRQSIRGGSAAADGLPLHALTLLFAQGYDGLPITSTGAPLGSYFGPADYYETAAYVGVIALVLAGLALLRAWRRPAVIGLGAMALFTLLVVYDLDSGAPIQRFIRAVGLQSVALQRMLPVLGLAVAVLAGLGLELLLARWRERATSIALLTSVTLVGAVVAFLWVKASGLGAIVAGGTRPLNGAAVRRLALRWPTAELVVLLLAALVLALVARHGRRYSPTSHGLGQLGILAGAGLVAVQGAFLVVAGSGINSYAATAYPVTPAVARLESIVGHHLVGLDTGTDNCADAVPGVACGVRSWAGIGFYPDINLAYGVAELAVHDPLTPKAYFAAWPIPDSGQEGVGPNVFAPSIDTVALARRYGVQYVLIQPVRPVPAGMELVTTIEDPSHEPLELARVPDSEQFSFDTTTAGAAAAGGPAAVLSVGHPDDVTYRLHVETPVRRRLDIRITDVPGWQATADGQPLVLSRNHGDLLSAVVPAGTREVVLTYQPGLLAVGWVLALATLVLLAGAVVVSFVVRRWRRRPS